MIYLEDYFAWDVDTVTLSRLRKELDIMLPYVLLEQQFMWAGQINICQFIKPLICEYSRYQQMHGYPRPIDCESLAYYGMSDFDYAPDWEWIPDFIDPKNSTENGTIRTLISIYAVLSLLL